MRLWGSITVLIIIGRSKFRRGSRTNLYQFKEMLDGRGTVTERLMNDVVEDQACANGTGGRRE